MLNPVETMGRFSSFVNQAIFNTCSKTGRRTALVFYLSLSSLNQDEGIKTAYACRHYEAKQVTVFYFKEIILNVPKLCHNHEVWAACYTIRVFYQVKCFFMMPHCIGEYIYYLNYPSFFFICIVLS